MNELLRLRDDTRKKGDREVIPTEFKLALCDRTDTDSRLILADWLEERGDPIAVRMRRHPRGYGNGYGGGYGDGYGYGYGDGNGYGYGYGDGNGYGGGYGDGDGNGYGYGNGYGNGYGYGNGEKFKPRNEEKILKIGEHYLCVAGDGWVFAGEFAGVNDLGQYTLVNAVNVSRTGGTPWPRLADGEGRENATLVEWGTICMDRIVACRKWVVV